MPWNPVDMTTLRQEFVALASQEGVMTFSALCQRFGISRKTGYKWLARWRAQGSAGLTEHARRPLHSPMQTAACLEQLVIDLRLRHPCWGARKLHRRLQDLGHTSLPTPSTITRILHRHGLISQEASAQATAWQRFEHAAPNDLWQMDFKGYFETGQARCHPLTVLDDHSRYNLVLQACSRPDRQTVQAALETTFRRYGMPVRINTDNGAPWGSPSQHEHGMTQLTVWLITLGIRISHSRPYHPQTNGKEERFHRTLKAEVLQGQLFGSMGQVQTAFDQWRDVYNRQRPHEALGLATPVSRYRPSRLAYPDALPEIVYPDGDVVQTVGWNGSAVLAGRRFKVSSALHRHRIAARPVPQQDGLYELYFAHHRFGHIDLRCRDG